MGGSRLASLPTTDGKRNRGCHPELPRRWDGWLRETRHPSHLLAVDRLPEGLRRPKRRRRRGRDVDGLPGPGIASLTRRAAAGRELPEPRDGHRLVVRQGVADGGEHGADQTIGGSPGYRRLGGDVRDEVGLVHRLFFLNGDRIRDSGARSDRACRRCGYHATGVGSGPGASGPA